MYDRNPVSLFHLSVVRLASPLRRPRPDRKGGRSPSAAGGFALGLHVVGVGADLQKRLCGVLHTPDDNRTNINWIADSVIDLKRAALQCLQTARDFPLGIERIDPPKTRPVFSADVAPEQ